MSQPALTTTPRPAHPARLFSAIVLLLVGAVMFYVLAVRPRAPKHLKLALLTWTQDPFWEPLIRGAQDCASQANVDLTVVRSKPTVDDQNQHIRELLDAGVDGIAISPNDASAQLAILNDAAARVPIVTFDSDAPSSKRRRFVGIDNYAAGRFSADEIREALPDGGPILISVGSATMQHGRDRRQGVIDGLLERGFDRNRPSDPIDGELKGPKYTVVATVTDGADPSKAVVTIAEALRAHPEVKGIVGLFSYSAPAALEAMKQVGRTGQIQVVGFDESLETQQAIEAGTIHSSILQDSQRAGYQAIEVLANEARGIAPGPAEQSAILNVDINVLTPKNLPLLRESGAIRPATSQPSGT
ncbi:MAG TPA: substrate-binding domain-containing protein [Tepidisphaeraceae bacterium]|nr:substrate-binding domain-containing protein [Tepidisphaeraceae bacterium]